MLIDRSLIPTLHCVYVHTTGFWYRTRAPCVGTRAFTLSAAEPRGKKLGKVSDNHLAKSI